MVTHCRVYFYLCMHVCIYICMCLYTQYVSDQRAARPVLLGQPYLEQLSGALHSVLVHLHCHRAATADASAAAAGGAAAAAGAAANKGAGVSSSSKGEEASTPI